MKIVSTRNSKTGSYVYMLYANKTVRVIAPSIYESICGRLVKQIPAKVKILTHGVYIAKHSINDCTTTETLIYEKPLLTRDHIALCYLSMF